MADRLIDIPIARKVPVGEFRLDAQLEASRIRSDRFFLATGINQNFDIEFRTERTSPGARVGTFDLGYNLQPPITDLSPGISIGVQDALDLTKDGRRAYAVVTYRQGVADDSVNSFIDTSIGIRVGKHTFPFLGVDLPIAGQLHGLVEHNGERISAGLEARILPTFKVRLLWQEHDTILSAQYSIHIKGF